MDKNYRGAGAIGAVEVEDREAAQGPKAQTALPVCNGVYVEKRRRRDEQHTSRADLVFLEILNIVQLRDAARMRSTAPIHASRDAHLTSRASGTTRDR
ncbi:hypothetical protein WL92_12650 [Burkholderia multivorans]|nr:hypothetical protein WL92_12650 [Burkholderia multivorans]